MVWLAPQVPPMTQADKKKGKFQRLPLGPGMLYESQISDNVIQVKTERHVYRMRVKRKPYSACGAQREVVHLLGEGGHYTGGMKGQTGLNGCSWSDHSTLNQEGRRDKTEY